MLFNEEIPQDLKPQFEQFKEDSSQAQLRKQEGAPQQNHVENIIPKVKPTEKEDVQMNDESQPKEKVMSSLDDQLAQIQEQIRL